MPNFEVKYQLPLSRKLSGLANGLKKNRKKLEATIK